jgi:serine protease AprX
MQKRLLTIFALLVAFAAPALAAGHGGDRKLDAVLRQRAHAPRGTSRVIIQTKDGASADALIRSLRGKAGRRLHLLHAQVAEIPDAALDDLANRPAVTAVHLDRRVHGTMERTGAAVGSTWAQQNLGFDGSGVGVAIIDSGVTPWHDDLGAERVVHFADFVNYQPTPYDDYGHGTHVAGIVAGSGYDSNGARRGIAPGASLVVLKVLDGTGTGYISNVIAALDYATENRVAYNIRVINLSVAAGIYESYKTDLFTLAAKRAVDAGLVVVTAAGNLGRNTSGQPQYGGITAPGNAPWVLTVGASSHMGTADRTDDTVAGFSSLGPTYIDYVAKPDLVAPGVGIESLTDANSLLYATYPNARLWGTLETVTEPYLSLTGTSMSAPVVSGTVALMLQANPGLTPNAVKAILQYTAEVKDGYKALAQGAGFLNARGAVDLAQKFSGTPMTFNTFLAPEPSPTDTTPWSRHIVWGSHRVGGGMITPESNAWSTSVTWGDATMPDGENIVWGTQCDPNADPNCENIVWGTSAYCDPALDPTCENIVWGTQCDPNTDPNCGENIVWGTSSQPCDPAVDPLCENIVWGTSDSENIVWGTDCGGADCENIVWGTSSQPCDPAVDPLCENIVWGTADPGENIVWGTSCNPDGSGCENIVWGTSGYENIVWGTGGDENIVWGTNSPGETIVWGTRAPKPVGESSR